MYRLVVTGRLPGMNEYTKACRTHAQVGAQMKKEAEEKVLGYIFQQIPYLAITCPVELEFLWVEKDKRRDPDNISGFGHKVILDALVKAGVLIDDSVMYVKGFNDKFAVDKKNPRIEVMIRGID